MDRCMCILYIICIVIIAIIVYNNRNLYEGFKISHSDNKINLKPIKTHVVKRYKNIYNERMRQNTNLSNITDTGPKYNIRGYGNNSSESVYNTKHDMNYERMISDLFGNYTDPNKEVNEMCAPPSLCKINAIKNKFTCGCGNNVGKCFDTLSKKVTGGDISGDLIEGYANYDKRDSLKGVFYTDYGGGEKYIPCGECQEGFIKNAEGKCEKRCHNCKTYTTDQENMLLKIDNDRVNRFKGCDECSSCGDCSNCNNYDNQCACKGNVRNDNQCPNCMRCTNCNNCSNKRKNSYFNMEDLNLTK